MHVAAAVRQLDEALEHAEAHLRIVDDAHYFRCHPAADAVELMMRLMFGQSRVLVGRVLHPGARRSARSVARAQSQRAPPAPFCRATSTEW
jgi:hypothetical protein